MENADDQTTPQESGAWVRSKEGNKAGNFEVSSL
jgi:hypothetical protein